MRISHTSHLVLGWHKGVPHGSQRVSKQFNHFYSNYIKQLTDEVVRASVGVG